jgi:hypothetical protein
VLIIGTRGGFATDRTVSGSATYPGRSGLAAAFAATALFDGVGLVAQVGDDFDLGDLKALQIGLEGVEVRPGASARFRIGQFRDGACRSALTWASRPTANSSASGRN